MLDISIHALLAESDLPPHQQKRSNRISIHALLAESDGIGLVFLWWGVRFLSTLSLRRATIRKRQIISIIQFLSTLSLRRATIPFIRSSAVCIFLSTLSLRRATHRKKRCCPWRSDFYPRSPCGERRTGKSTTAIFYLFLSTLSLRRATYNAAFYHCRYFISIHALLAESDGDEMESRADFRISIHALLAESDPRWVSASALPKAFLSTLSLRRATMLRLKSKPDIEISIHALLAESDI